MRPPGRALALLSALVVVGVLAAACGGPDDGADGSGDVAAGTALVPVVDDEGIIPAPERPVTVTGADGRSVVVDDVSRIVPLWGNVAEVTFALGLGDNVVGRDTSATFAEAADLPVVTSAHDVSAESVLSLRPTVVLADSETGPPEALDHIRNVGIPVVVIERPTSVGGIDDGIRAVAAALGVPEAGERLVDETLAEIDAVTSDVPSDGEAPRVAFLYVRGGAGVYLLGGPGAGTDSLIAAAGGIDAGTAAGLSDPFTPITSEALVSAAPDVIMVTTTGLDSVGGIDGLAEIPGIAQTPAGRDRRVITVEDGLLFSFGPRTAETLSRIAAQIHQ